MCNHLFTNTVYIERHHTDRTLRIRQCANQRCRVLIPEMRDSGLGVFSDYQRLQGKSASHLLARAAAEKMGI